ncbi:hypothetical protein EVAR_74219_1 [Eumeta japonica]|uniref:Nuclear protein MDM1 n=1 Tax=Eumeta variegata TaxID=151549 RepID=A0A4C1SCJ3_EUMVA|nr:hypothetical protein EVAR_74219_1 [Eumeta japonica]
MVLLQLHSEYRSTYRWHEYRGEAAAQGAGAGAGVAQQPARQPPNALPLNRGPTEPAMPRRKKYPGVAYKTNELFEPAPPAPLTATAPSDRARSAERGDAGRAGRRSKSEGPRQPRWTDTVEPKATTALGEVLATKEPETVSTEYRNQFAWPKDSGDTPRKSISMGALKKAAAGHDGGLLGDRTPDEQRGGPQRRTRAQEVHRGLPLERPKAGRAKIALSAFSRAARRGDSAQPARCAKALKARRSAPEARSRRQPSYTGALRERSRLYFAIITTCARSTSKRLRLKMKFCRKSTFRSALSALISTGEDRNKDNRKRYKSEYKKKFRPFSQYVYEASKGTFTKCRGSKGKAGVSDEGASERMLPEKGEGEGASAGVGDNSAATLRATGLQPLGLSQSDSWYREVLDLRKRAGEYKVCTTPLPFTNILSNSVPRDTFTTHLTFIINRLSYTSYRGWGTELAPDHLTQIYNKQIELWYQVSRRSSLSALSLASTDHKALPRDEKDSKESRNHSPKKFRSFKSAPHQSIHAKLQETKALERSPHKTSPQKQRKKLQGHSFDEGAVHEEATPSHTRFCKWITLSAAKAGEGKAEFKSPRRRPRSADPAPAHSKHLPNGHEPHPRPHKPSGLPLSSRGSRVRSSVSVTRTAKSPSCPTKSPVTQRRSRSVSKVGIKLDDEPIPQRSASVAKEQYWDDSPVVKSPPEPTRVKSPEQLNVRSPDPVNWTVPLDTGKTFTVTQNVKSDEGVKRPSSEFKAGSAPDEQGAPHAAA